MHGGQISSLPLIQRHFPLRVSFINSTVSSQKQFGTICGDNKYQLFKTPNNQPWTFQWHPEKLTPRRRQWLEAQTLPLFIVKTKLYQGRILTSLRIIFHKLLLSSYAMSQPSKIRPNRTTTPNWMPLWQTCHNKSRIFELCSSTTKILLPNLSATPWKRVINLTLRLKLPRRDFPGERHLTSTSPKNQGVETWDLILTNFGEKRTIVSKVSWTEREVRGPRGLETKTVHSMWQTHPPL